MRQILMPIKPEGVEKILSGEKTLEIRKTAPKEWIDYIKGKTDRKPDPTTAFLYCEKGRVAVEWWSGVGFPGVINGWVFAKFALKKVEGCVNPFFPKGSFATPTMTYEYVLEKSCMSAGQLDACLGGKGKRGYAWHISDLEVFDEPKELSEFLAKNACRDCPHRHSPNRDMCDICEGLKPMTHAPNDWRYAEVR